MRQIAESRGLAKILSFLRKQESPTLFKIPAFAGMTVIGKAGMDRGQKNAAPGDGVNDGESPAG
jgi:hypothetical protein